MKLLWFLCSLGRDMQQMITSEVNTRSCTELRGDCSLSTLVHPEPFRQERSVPSDGGQRPTKQRRRRPRSGQRLPYASQGSALHTIMFPDGTCSCLVVVSWRICSVLNTAVVYGLL